MRILLIGADGQLGQDLRRAFQQDEVMAAYHHELEISDGAAVRRCVEDAQPDCIINTAAFHPLEKCEREPAKALAVNAAGARYLAQAAQPSGVVLVHFSTDYVFDGRRRSPYVETDTPAPLSIYGISKLAGEWAIQRYCEKHFIIRTSTLFGPRAPGHGRENFVARMLRLADEGKPIRVASDQTRSPTSTRDLAEKLVPVIHSHAYGLYHMTNSGGCTWYEFAQEIFRQAGLSAEVVATTSQELGIWLRRPEYSVLDNAALRAAGFPDLLPWQEALAVYLRERRKRR